MRKALSSLDILSKTVIVPRAFELNPDAPNETPLNGVNTIAARYGLTLEQARREFDKIAMMGKADGLVLNQVDTYHTNTFNSHRLMKLGLASGDKNLAWRLNELLFAAFFVDNLNLASRDVLVEVGTKAGLEKMDIVKMLDSEEYGPEVRADESEAGKRGIHAVPYFLFENGQTISGALPVEDFIKVLRNQSVTDGEHCTADGCRLY